jgi:hypothetical protein
MMKRTLARLIVLTFTFAAADTSLADLSTGLSGYWQFDGNGNDSSGNGNNLTLTGSPGFGTGLFGQALALNNNNNQYASLSSNSSAFGLTSGDFTIQLWVNFNAGINSREQTLLEKFTGSNGNGWTISTPGGDSLIFDATGVGTLRSTMTLTTGVWNQVIISRAGNEYTMYYDGVDVDSFSSSTAIAATTNPLLFGKRDAQDGRDFALNGSLDEVGIWDRALSTTEISELCNNGNGLVIPLAVPEPSSMTLCGIAALTGAGLAWRRRRAQRSR